MKYSFGAAALLAVSAHASSGCVDDNDNYFCALVDKITYESVGGSGSYNRVTDMNSDKDTCSSTSYGYSGSLSPLNEEISIHLRGPLTLKQFAAYSPGSLSSKKAKRSTHGHAHGHMHQHLHNKRAVGDMVTATIDGVVQSWVNEYAGGAATVSAAAVTSAAGTPSAYSAPAADSSSSASAASSSSSASDDSDSSSGSWTRQSFYDGSSSDGLVFLNHEGGTAGSGVWDTSFGNSLSYASSNGCEGAADPTMLAADTLIPSSGEVVIMTDSKCDGDCGYVRPGTVAYHGFDGDDKAFFFEFQMPDDGGDSSSEYDAVNMPAIWSLNAQIPRTLQYGNEDCSCWASGCGEFDIFEVLIAGDARMKSTMHGNKAGGSSDYFYRPYNSPIIGAMIMSNNQIQVKILPNDTSFDFPSSMSQTTLNSYADETETNGLGSADFSLADATSG